MKRGRHAAYRDSHPPSTRVQPACTNCQNRFFQDGRPTTGGRLHCSWRPTMWSGSQVEPGRDASEKEKARNVHFRHKQRRVTADGIIATRLVTASFLLAS